MDVWGGVDLGSTTTKAVLLDRGGEILGKGITNSRSNYEVAAAVARSEALIDARFALVRAALSAERAFDDAGKLEAFLARLGRAFRLEQHRVALARLGALAQEDVETRLGGAGSTLGQALGEVLRTLEVEAKRLFLFGGPQTSDFFRDLAGSHWQKAAEREAKRTGADFERLMGVFDKAILVVENEPLDLSFARSIARALTSALEQAGIDDPGRRRDLEASILAAADAEIALRGVIGTGYGRQRLPFPKESIRSEILCHGLGAHRMFPRTATVLDIGGQDTKAIQLDTSGIVTTFQMNDRCAAGCGRYLGYIADEMSLGLHELGPLAMESCSPVKINSTCTVFAGAELRDRLSMGEKREDVLAGLHRAIVLRAMSLLARSGGIRDEFTFTGGVAKNGMAVRVLRQLVKENYGERTLNISPDSIYTGAIGAALFSLRDARGKEAAA